MHSGCDNESNIASLNLKRPQMGKKDKTGSSTVEGLCFVFCSVNLGELL